MPLPGRYGPRWILYHLVSTVLLAAGLHGVIVAPKPAVRLRNASPSHAIAPRLVIVLMDALSAEAASDKALMPHLQRLSTEGASGRAKTPRVTMTGPSLEAIFTGMDADVHSLLINFRAGIRGPNSLIDIACAAGKRVLLLSPNIRPEDSGCRERPGAFERFPGARGAGVKDKSSWLDLPGLLERREADLTLIHLYAADLTGHVYGGRSRQYRERARAYDEILGELARKLDASDTVLFAYGDHGMSERGYHSSLEDLVTETPFVFWGRGIRPGVELTIEQADLAATFAELLGLPHPKRSRGKLLTGIFDVDERRLAQMMTRSMAQKGNLLHGRVEPAQAAEMSAAVSNAHAALARGAFKDVAYEFGVFLNRHDALERGAFNHRGRRIGILLLAGLLPSLWIILKGRTWADAALLLSACASLGAFNRHDVAYLAAFLLILSCALYELNRAGGWKRAAGAGLAAGVTVALGWLATRGAVESSGAKQLAVQLAAALAGTGLLRQWLKGGKTQSAAWTSLVLIAAALVCRAFAADGTHAPFLFLAAAAVGAWAANSALSRETPWRGQRLAVFFAAFLALALYYNNRTEVLVFVSFAWLVELMGPFWSSRRVSPAAAALVYLALRFLVFFASGNDLTFQLADFQNPFLIGGESPLNLLALTGAFAVKLVFPEILLLMMISRGDARGGPKTGRDPALYPTVTACYELFLVASTVRLAFISANAPIHWVEALPALTMLASMALFLPAAAAAQALNGRGD